MPVEAVWAWLGLFILAGFTLEAITGFGGSLIALALGALWLPIGTLVLGFYPLPLTDLMEPSIAKLAMQIASSKLL